jgi:hypothetical protein
MAQSVQSSSVVLKVDFDGDTRRVSLLGVAVAPAAEILKRIRDTVANAFEIEEALLPVLKYQDDEGDLCTLVASSVTDMLQLNHGRAVRLFVARNDEAMAVKASSDETVKASIDVAPAGTSGQDGDQTDVQSAPEANRTHFLLQTCLRQSESTSLKVAERHLQGSIRSSVSADHNDLEFSAEKAWGQMVQHMQLQEELDLETPSVASVANWHHMLQQMELHQNDRCPVVNRWRRLIQQMEHNDVRESGERVPESIQLQESTAATTLDNAQVLLSQSMSTIRSARKQLVRALRMGS